MDPGIAMYECQLGLYCGRMGRIQVHVVGPDKLICLKCCAGEERVPQKKVRADARDPGDPRIHYARSINHRCP